jgi:purine-binding chemotaxis protein CheW
MNLADIRKKAIMERDSRKGTLPGAVKPDAPADEFVETVFKSVIPDSEVEDEVEDAVSGVPEPGNKLLPDFEDALIESEPAPVSPVLQHDTPPVIAAPAIPASTALEFSAADVPVAGGGPLFPSVMEEEDFRGTLAGVSFNPLAILMAGREAAGLDMDLAPESTDLEEVREADYQEFLCFRVSSEEYAVNIMEIKEIIRPREITEVPRVPDFISGVLSLRGIIIPVFDMRRRLHLSSSESGVKERIIVVSRGEELFGIQVDEVLQVVRISENLIEQPPAILEGIDRDFVLGIGRHDSRMLIMLNLANILDVNLC